MVQDHQYLQKVLWAQMVLGDQEDLEVQQDLVVLYLLQRQLVQMVQMVQQGLLALQDPEVQVHLENLVDLGHLQLLGLQKHLESQWALKVLVGLEDLVNQLDLQIQVVL